MIAFEKSNKLPSALVNRQKWQAFTLLLFFITFQTFAGGIRGVVKTTKNEPLAYAAVAIRGAATGTMANAEGRFELNLAAGKYTILFQYSGLALPKQCLSL